MLWWALVSGMLIPLAMIGSFPVFRHHARGEPNAWSGYRTTRATSSTSNWREANLLAGKYWLRYGVVLGVACLATYAVLYLSGNRSAETWQNTALVLAFVGMGVMAVPFIPIERHLAAKDRAAER